MVRTRALAFDTSLRKPLATRPEHQLHVDSMHAKTPPIHRSGPFGKAEPSKKAHCMLTRRHLQVSDAVFSKDRKGSRDHGAANTPSMNGGIHHDPIDGGVETLDR